MPSGQLIEPSGFPETRMKDGNLYRSKTDSAAQSARTSSTVRRLVSGSGCSERHSIDEDWKYCCVHCPRVRAEVVCQDSNRCEACWVFLSTARLAKAAETGDY